MTKSNIMNSDKGRLTPQSSLPTTRIDDSHPLLLSQEYHKRLHSLHQEISHIQHSLLNDDLTQTMRKDPTTAQFLPARTSEVIETLLIREQENTIDRLISELAAAKGEIKRLESLPDPKDTQTDLSYSSRRDSADAESRLTVATKEIARARQALEDEMDNSAQLHSTISVLETRLQSTELTLSRAHLELDENERNRLEMNQKLEEKTALCEEMRLQMESYEREVRELEAKYRAYSGEFREILTASMGKQSQTHREKTALFKQKVLQQREKIRALEEERERLIGDLNQFGGKNRALEEEIGTKTAEIQQLQDNYQVRAAELQLSLQNTLEDRVSALKSNYEALLVAAKEREAQLVKSFEAKSADFQGNYMKKEAHELIFSTEIEKMRKKAADEKAVLERELRLEANSRLSTLKDEFADEKKRFLARISDLESEKATLSLKKKDLERLFEEAETRIRELNSRLAKTTLEIESLTEQKIALLARSQDLERQLAQEKELYDQEYAVRIRLEGEMGKLRTEVETVRGEVEERKREIGAKGRELRGEIEVLTKENGQLRKELREIAAKSQDLAEEKTQTVQKLSKSSQEQIEALERLRQQEKQSFSVEFDSFHQTKSLLTAQISTLRREHESLKLRDRSLLSKLTKDYKEDLRELKLTLARDLNDFRRVITASVTTTLAEVDRNQQITARERDRLVTLAHFDRESVQLASQRDLQSQTLDYEQKMTTLEAALDHLHTEVEGKNDQLEDLLTKLEAFKQREGELSRRAGDYEADLKSACEDLETWKNASFAVEEKNAELTEKMRTLEEVVEKLKARNEENMAFFDQEIVTLGEKYRITDQRLNDQFAKLREAKDSEALVVENDLKSLKATTISSLAAYESDLSLLVRSIQSDELRYTAQIQRLQAENASQILRFQAIQQQVKAALVRAEEVQREKEALAAELRTAKEDITRFQIKEVRVEMMKTEEMMRESSKDRGK